MLNRKQFNAAVKSLRRIFNLNVSDDIEVTPGQVITVPVAGEDIGVVELIDFSVVGEVVYDTDLDTVTCELFPKLGGKDLESYVIRGFYEPTTGWCYRMEYL